MLSSILVVCTANICRSPAAAALLRAALAESSSTIQISSAGVRALPGRGADPLMCAQMQPLLPEHEQRALGQHTARAISVPLLRSADLVLAMEPSHVQACLAFAPFLRGRVMLFDSPQRLAIADPFGQSVEHYQQCVAHMQRCVGWWSSFLIDTHAPAAPFAA